MKLKIFRRLFSLMLALALLCACAAPQEPQEVAADEAGDGQEQRVYEAYALIQDGEYGEAATLLELVLASGGDDEELLEAACMQLFYLYVTLEEYDSALSVLETGAQTPGTEAIINMRDVLLNGPDTVIEGVGAERAYPYTTYPVWVEGGTQAAIPEGRLVRYVDLDNETVREVLLDTIWFGTLGIYDGMIMSLNGNAFVAVLDGEWTAFNLTFFDPETGRMTGRLESAEPADRTSLADGRAVENPMWVTVAGVDGEHVALVGQERVFLYNVPDDSLTLVDDLSEWLYAQPEPDYRGILGDVYQDGEAVYYLRLDQEDGTGTVWRLDKDGAGALFGGQTFASLMVRNGLMIMKDDAEGAGYSWARVDDMELHPVTLDGSSAYFRIDGTRISAPGNSGIYCIETQTGEVSLYTIAIDLYLYAGTIEADGELQIVYTDPDLTDQYVYMQNIDSNEIALLPWFATYETSELHALGTHYFEYGEDDESVDTVRVLPLEPIAVAQLPEGQR